MGNKQRRQGTSKYLRRLREHVKRIRELKNCKKSHQTPKALRVLCERAIKKYKLLPEPKKFTPPETFYVVGGKPLRKRAGRLPSLKIKKEKRFHPKSLAWLCQRVVEEYNLLPQNEETLQPSSHMLPIQKYKFSQNISKFQSNEVEKKSRGRPKKKTNEEMPCALSCKIKRPRGRPHKDPSADSYVVEYNYPQEENVRVKEELDLEYEDPLVQDDEGDYTIEIKEETVGDDHEEFTDTPTVSVPQVTPQGILLNPLAPGPSKAIPPTANYITVVMDDYQIFANSVAEQLRTLPPNRALLLQLDIQTMIDNEKQLMRHET